MHVYIVINCSGAGSIAGVFSTLDKATAYVAYYQYGTFIIAEHTVDSVEVMSNATS